MQVQLHKLLILRFNLLALNYLVKGFPFWQSSLIIKKLNTLIVNLFVPQYRLVGNGLRLAHNKQWYSYFNLD